MWTWSKRMRTPVVWLILVAGCTSKPLDGTPDDRSMEPEDAAADRSEDLSPPTVDASMDSAIDLATPVPSCADRITNNDETDIDCGGSCRGCEAGQGCRGASDCLSRFCTNQR